MVDGDGDWCLQYTFPDNDNTFCGIRPDVIASYNLLLEYFPLFIQPVQFDPFFVIAVVSESS